MTDCDFLVVGHGIAGATLAYVLRQRGHRVLVYDPGQANSASNVAAGLMNPVAGKRFALSWRAAELLPAAAAFYRELERRYGQNFFTETPIFKIFSLARRAERHAGPQRRPALGRLRGRPHHHRPRPAGRARALWRGLAAARRPRGRARAAGRPGRRRPARGLAAARNF